MSVRVEKSGSVWTVIHSRPEARNAMTTAMKSGTAWSPLKIDGMT